MVKVGIHDRIADHDDVRSYPVRQIIRHKHFKKAKYNILINDIALLQVDEITYNDYIQPICLPSLSGK